MTRLRFWPRGERGAVAILFALCGSLMIAALTTALDSIVEAMSISRSQAASDVASLSIGNDVLHFSTTSGADLSQLQADALAYYNANMTGSLNELTVNASQFNMTVSGTIASGLTISLSVSSTFTLPFALTLGAPSSTSSTTTGSSTSTGTSSSSGSGSSSGTSSGSTGTSTSTGTTTTSGGPLTTTTVTVNSTVTRIPNSTLEMVLVFDNTGSMADTINTGATSHGRPVTTTKLKGLQDAADTLVGDVMGQATGTSYVGLVPFSTTVNVKGALLPSGSWFNPAFDYNSNGVQIAADSTHDGWYGCVAEPRDSNKYLYPLPYSPNDKLKFTPYYYNVPPGGLNVRTYNATTTTKGKNNQYTTTGGICSSPVAKTTPLKGVPITLSNGEINYCGYSATQQGTGIGYNFDVSPDSSRFGVSGTVRQNTDCITDSVTFLTTDKNTITNGIAAMNASGSTIIPTGILWGWRMLTPSWSNNSAGSGNGWVSSNNNLPLPLTTASLQRVMVVLTDGENDVGVKYTIPNDLYFNGLSGVGTNSLAAPTVMHSASGKPMTDGLMDSSETVPLASNGIGDPTDIDDFQIAACTAIKNSGITIYAITYGSVSDVAAATMTSCASPGNYYHAPDTNTLNTIFSDIASSLGILRLTQ